MHGNQAMGPRNALHTPGWVEVTLPYKLHRNEDEMDLDPHYTGPKPSWEIWDWLEYSVANMHDDEDGDVAWWRTTRMFQFFFRDPKIAARFALRFNGQVFVVND